MADISSIGAWATHQPTPVGSQSGRSDENGFSWERRLPMSEMRFVETASVLTPPVAPTGLSEIPRRGHDSPTLI